MTVSGHEKGPEGVEAAPLIGTGDGVALVDHLFQERAPRTFPARDALANATVQDTEVLLHLTEVTEQVPGDLHELLETVLEGGIVEQREITLACTRNLGFDLVATALKIGDTYLRVFLYTFVHLPQQAEQRAQARLGADKTAFRQRSEPRYGFLGGGSEVELGFVGIVPIELAQPATIRVCPVVQIVQGRTRERAVAIAFAQSEQLILQALRKIALRDHPTVRFHEHAVQKARHQRGVLRPQQPPPRMTLPKPIQGVVVEVHSGKMLFQPRLAASTPARISSIETPSALPTR